MVLSVNSRRCVCWCLVELSWLVGCSGSIWLLHFFSWLQYPELNFLLSMENFQVGFVELGLASVVFFFFSGSWQTLEMASDPGQIVLMTSSILIVLCVLHPLTLVVLFSDGRLNDPCSICSLLISLLGLACSDFGCACWVAVVGVGFDPGRVLWYSWFAP